MEDDNKIIQFRPKSDVKKCFGESMCPSDWKTPYQPTYDELRLTMISLEECVQDTQSQLLTAGVQSEFILRDRLRDLKQMRALLLDYYKAD
jgi:hypothetical protein